ncbi:MAG: SGNH/GDSL hydrolase family protein [Gammaproteobacteria bacterium]
MAETTKAASDHGSACTAFSISKWLIDFSLIVIVLLIGVITLRGGIQADIFGISLNANTPAGPVKALIVALLLRAFLVLRIADALLLLLSIVLSMLLAEGILRFWDAPITKFQLTQIHRPSSTAQWDLIPGASAVANTGATYRINSRGCRDREYSLEKPEGIFRILALGDSFTFGMGVEAEDTYPKQLEEILNGKGYPVEVINCAVVGYDMWQHKVALREKALVYHPDLVMLGIFVNDLMFSYPPPEIRKPGYRGKNPFAKQGTRNWLHKSFLYNTIRNAEDLLKFRFRAKLGAKHLEGIVARKQIWGPANPEDPHYRLLVGTAEPRLYDEYKTSLTEFVSIARRSGTEVFLLLLPDSVQLHDPSMQALNRFIANLAAESDTPFLDLTPFLESQKDPESLYLFPDDAHNSPKGMSVIAEAIAGALENISKPGGRVPSIESSRPFPG